MNSTASLPIWKTIKYLLGGSSDIAKGIAKYCILSLIWTSLIYWLLSKCFPQISFGDIYVTVCMAINVIMFLYLSSNSSSKAKGTRKDLISSLIWMLLIYYLLSRVLPQFFFSNIYFAVYSINNIMLINIIISSRNYLKMLLLDYYKNQNIEVIRYNNLVYACYLLVFSSAVSIIFFVPNMLWSAIWNVRLQPVLNISNNNYGWNLGYILRLVTISWIVTFIIFFLFFTSLVALLFSMLMLDQKFSFDHTSIVFACIGFILLLLISFTAVMYSELTDKLSLIMHFNFPNSSTQENKPIAID